MQNDKMDSNQSLLWDYAKHNYATLEFAYQTPGFLILCETYYSNN